MSFFIEDALAETAAAAGPASGLMSFLPLFIIFLVFYFLLIRPQMKRAKEHKSLVSALGKDDEIITSGGLLGRITDLGDDFVSVEISDGVNVKVQRQAVATVLPKGTIKGM
jgi:preprotein translocase subunit YajC